MSERRSPIRPGEPGPPPAGQTRYTTSLDGQAISVDARTPDEAQSFLRHAYPGRTFSLTTEPTAPRPTMDELFGTPAGAVPPIPAAPAARPTMDELFGQPAAAPPDPEGPFARYTGKPDLPLEESLNPAELVIGGYGAKAGQLLTRNAGKLVTLGAEGLGLEAGYKVNQAVGNTPGRITDFGWPDVANFATPYVQEGVVQVGKGLLRAGRAGQAVQVADKATTTERAAYETTLAEAEAAHAAATRDALVTSAKAEAQRRPWSSTWGTPEPPPVPQTLQSLRATPPTPVPPTIKESGADPYRRLGELSLSAYSALNSGHPVKSLLGGAALVGADKGYDAFSRWLVSPPILPYFRQAIGPSGDLNPKTMTVLSELFKASLQPASPAGP